MVENLNITKITKCFILKSTVCCIGGVVTGSWKRKFGEKTIRKRELKLKIQREGGIEAKMQRDEGRSI